LVNIEKKQIKIMGNRTIYALSDYKGNFDYPKADVKSLIIQEWT